jgi:hypothetical protein
MALTPTKKAPYRENESVPNTKSPGIRKDTGAISSESYLPSLRVIPSVDISLGFVFGFAVALLDFSLELLTLAVDYIEIIISEFTPLLFDLALDLLPITFNTIPCHNFSSMLVMSDQRDCGEKSSALLGLPARDGRWATPENV